MSTTRIRRFVLVTLLALTVGGIAAVSARADAPDVKVTSPAPGQHPYQTGVATVDTVTGHVTVDLTGGWSWPTHNADCNTNRAGAGVAVNWLDPTDRGFHLGYFAINGGTANTTAGGPARFDGTFTISARNNNTVSYLDSGAAVAATNTSGTITDSSSGNVVDIGSPSQFANWRGGCGVFSTDPILVNNHGVLSYTTGTVAHGNFGKATPSSVDSGGVPFNDPTPPSNPAQQGALLQHVYPSTADMTHCGVMYDAHPGANASENNGVGIPNGQSEVTAGDQAVAAGANYMNIHNGDNSIQQNGGTPAGNTCPQSFFPTISTKLSSSSVSTGDSVSDTAKLAGNSSDAGGTVTYSVYSDSNCSTKVADGGTVTVTNGSVPGSNSVNFPNAGTFYWQAAYSGDGKNAPAKSPCKSPCTGEKLVVNAPAIHIVKTADAAQVNAGDQIGFTLTVFNTGLGDAKGVTLSDTLPVKSGLSWSIAGQGTGWGGSCAIAAGVLSCGPKTVPAGTTQAGSTFTVHVTSPTTAATGGVCPGGSGVVNNTGNVTTTNDGSGQSSASTCVTAPAIHIVKTADAAQVNAGDPIGFTLTVYNDGTGDAKGVTLSDTLPTNAGLSWSIAGQGTGWGGSCAIAAGVLSCGPKTVPAGTTQAGSTFTVHVTSPTTAATAGVCPGGSGVVSNTGNVTTTNAGSDQSQASTCVASAIIHIVKTADAAQVNAGDQIGFTLTVFNTGLGDAKGVTLSDTLPVKSGLSWSIAGQGTGWGGSCAIAAGVLSCGPKTVPAGTTQAGSTFTVYVTSPTTAATGGVCLQGSGVVDNTGNVTTTNAGSDQSSASTCVAAPAIHIVKTADAVQVNAGDPIGFTLTVYNDGTGDAKGVTLSDTLPVKAGLSWSIAGQGTGWGGSCAIAAGVLTCGPVTVPAGTTQAASTFTVHITSPTTAATGGTCPGGSGVVDNSGNVTTTNDGSDQSSASTCVAGPTVSITKTADHSAPVNAGGQIGFTVEIKNTGTGAATGVTLSDPLPAGSGSGVTWAIDTSVGTPAQFVLSGAKGSQTLSLASSTLPAGADYKVHITAQTSETECSVYDNTATLTTTNAGNPDPASAEESCAFRVDLAITKSGSPETQELGQGNISWTMVVTNNGPDTDTGVKVSDPMPAGNTYVSSTTTQGTCTGGAILTCNIGTMAAGAKVTITLITTPSQTGAQTNTAVVSGDRPETNLANNTATATVQITGAPFKIACVKVSKVTPRQLFVGRKTTLTIHLTQQGKAKGGVRVQIKGKKFKVVTKHSNAKGVIKQVVKMKRSGVLIFTPLTTGGVARCVGRIGVTGVFTPPVTG